MRPGDLDLGAARARGAAGAAGGWIASELLPASLLDGSRSLAPGSPVALGDGREDFDLGTVTAELREDEGGLRLTGRKRHVVGGAGAAHALVAARRDRVVLLVEVPLDAGGVSRAERRTIGRDGEADIAFEDVAVADTWLRGELTAARLDRARAVVALASAAAALGAIDRLLECSLERGHERHQFGRPVGSFQAFQHSCAEIAMERELAVRLVQRAGDTGTLRDSLRARAFNGAAATRAAARALQLQGGRGFLDASEVSRLYRAAKVAELRWGSVDAALRSISAT